MWQIQMNLCNEVHTITCNYSETIIDWFFIVLYMYMETIQETYHSTAGHHQELNLS